MLRSVGIAIALVSAACGRVGFDISDDGRTIVEAGPDTMQSCVGTSGHDEDGDGLDDSCDPCPHIAGGLADADGDGVGDDCDLQPDRSDRIAYFDPFTQMGTDWNYDGTMVMNDEVALPGIPAGRLELEGQGGPGMIGMGGRIDPLENFQQQLSIGYDLVGTEGYYCEMYWTGTVQYLAATYTLDGENFMVAPTTLPDVTASDVRLEMYNDGNRWRCVGEYLGVRYETPVVEVDWSGGQVEIAASGLATQARYFIRIAPN